MDETSVRAKHLGRHMGIMIETEGPTSSPSGSKLLGPNMLHGTKLLELSLNPNTTNSSMDPSQYPTSSYHVHPSENPDNAFVLLNGENYHQWTSAMRMNLISKQKMDFACERANSIIIFWITSVLWIIKSYEIWDELNERFSQDNMFRIAELQESIANFRQGDLSVTNYYIELKGLNDAYVALRSHIMIIAPSKHELSVFSCYSTRKTIPRARIGFQ
ncbi:hypothetical protein Lal_00017866 [Lupinus albus]|nr:hypothetical protein Lal_00017866 [Lupinus albus]